MEEAAVCKKKIAFFRPVFWSFIRTRESLKTEKKKKNKKNQVDQYEYGEEKDEEEEEEERDALDVVAFAQRNTRDKWLN